MKTFKLGILVGRFQTLHLGHEDMINKALSLCDRVAVFVGSSQESGTAKNPYSYEMRQSMLKAVFGDAIEVYPLPDLGVGNVPAWGEYVLNNVKDKCGTYPDLLITGKEERRTDWFAGVNGASVCELLVPKSIEISASQLRSYLINAEETSWREYTNPRLWEKYDTLRQQVLASKDNLETRSL